MAKTGRPHYLQQSEYQICIQCKETKSEKEFYKCKSRPTGLQAKCKTCQKIDGAKFRNQNPEYYNGSDESYFVKNKEQWNAYQRQFLKADKNSIVYCIETPFGLYIGSTKAYLWNRVSVHRRDYRRHIKGLAISTTPGLHEGWDKMGGDEWLKTLLDIKIVETFDVSMPSHILKQKEREYIQKFERQGIELLNIRGTRKDTGNKKRK